MGSPFVGRARSGYEGRAWVRLGPTYRLYGPGTVLVIMDKPRRRPRDGCNTHIISRVGRVVVSRSGLEMSYLRGCSRSLGQRGRWQNVV